MKGKQLYEATTDLYFGCGIGSESRRWQQKDWLGENVAGLVVRKVRDDILGISSRDLPDNTLTELIAEQGLAASCNMETETTGSYENQMLNPVNSSTSASQKLNSSRQGSPLPTYGNEYRESGSQTRGQRRGLGRGRGRGSWSNNNNRHSFNQARRPRYQMTSAERNFLGLEEKSISQRNMNRNLLNTRGASTPKKPTNPNQQSDLQKKGLEMLALSMNSDSLRGVIPTAGKY